MIRKVVLLDAGTYDRGDVDLAQFDRRWNCQVFTNTSAAELAEHLGNARIAVANKVRFESDFIASAACDALELIAVAATGTNNVDLAAAKARGIAVCNVAGYSGPSVAQHTFALILELATHVGQYAVDNRSDLWARSPYFTRLTYPCIELQGKTLGLIGYGDIARNVARIAEGFGMKVLVAGRKGQAAVPEGREPFDTLIGTADVLSIHCPLTPQTKGLIGAKEFAAMKPSAFLINTARGGIVDENALVEALQSGKIAGAGIDTLTVEPPPADHPLLLAARSLPQLILTPHSAWSTREARQRLLDEVCANIVAFERGELRNRV